MTLFAVERTKLFSTRSPWWCAALAVGLPIAFTGAMAASADEGLSVSGAMSGHQFGLMVVLVMAVLAITTEYRFGTIRATFQAVPDRASVLLSKAAVVGVTGFVLGELAGFGSWGLAQLLAPGPELALDSADRIREVAGAGPVFAVTAVLALGVGTLLRQTAGAVTLLIVWVLLGESLIALIPNIGSDLVQWMPFNVGSRFLTTFDDPSSVPLGPWASLAYFAAFAVVSLGAAIFAVQRRDA
ncbi:hypothetical protein [Saccharopolyspora gregorii]|uniref:ABC transporter permease n=1 Tax=Saccharopolyspora gregorii TaxID=33914 RepID=A0ABP6RI68_9PSEU|nr:hypothetical protein [Saccharopolyspora gregorii]